MEGGKLFQEIVKLLSEDENVVREIKYFVEALEIPWTIVKPLIYRYELGQKHPDVPLQRTLSEWIQRQGDLATVAELRRILRECELVATADGLQNLEEKNPGPIKLPDQLANARESDQQQAHSSRHPPPQETKKAPIVFGLKKVVLNFMGREEELDKLNEHFHSGECQIVCISGLGGIGKTELTKKFALSISYPSGNTQIDISWLSGETPQTILNSCSKFCLHLGLSATDAEGKPLTMDAMLENIMAKLNSSRWLVIIDNVDEIHEEFQNAVKILCDSGSDVFILVTSRRRDIFPGELELLEVNPLKLEDSVQFVKKSLKIDDNSSEDAIKSLCFQLGNFPLALGQAVAYIKQQQSTTLKGKAYGIQNYLDELAKTETLGLDTDSKLSEYSTATLKVWNITLDKILDVYGAEGKMTLHLLDVIAFINPDDIQIVFLLKMYKRFYSTEIDRAQVDFGLTLLLQYSLISSFDSVMSIHRLVQLALRDRMTSNRKYMGMLANFWTSFDEEEWNREDMPHILTIWNHSKPHRDLDTHGADKAKHVYYQLRDLGMVNESYNFATDGCKFLRDIYGSEHKEYLLMEQALAMAMREKGLYEQSLEKLTFVHEECKKHCGEDARETLATMLNIAQVLYQLQRFADCLEWNQRALQSQIKNYSENDEATMKIKNQLALALSQLGRGMEALELLFEVWEWEEVNLGLGSTLGTRHNIAACFFKAGMFAEALEAFQNVLPLAEEHFGVDHPNTLDTKGWLANTYYKIGEEGKAHELWDEVLTTREKVLGPHPQTTMVRGRVTALKQESDLPNKS